MPKILIVDDEPQVIHHVRALLKQFGYKSDFIAHPRFLFTILKEERFDLVLLDISMPGKDGLTLLKELKAHKKYGVIPVIMLTADINEHTLLQCFERGAVDFITKPISELILKARIKSALVAKEYEEGLEERIRERTETLRVTNQQLQYTIDQQKQTETALQYSNQQLIQEIGEHEKTEIQLKQSEQRFRSLSNSAPIGIFQTNAQGECTYVNPRWEAISGFNSEQTLTQHWGHIIHPEERETTLAEWEHFLEQDNEFAKEVRIAQPEEERLVSICCTPVLSEKGSVEGHVGILEDITERKKAEEALHEKIRMEGELKTAAAVQKALLPKELPQVPNLVLANYYQSATETCGDWHGVLTKIEGYVYLLIGDVTGHGSPAALVAATASASCKVLEEVFQTMEKTQQSLSPARLLEYLNTTVFKAGHQNFLMTFLAIRVELQTGTILFSNAGHTFPLLLHADGSINHLLNANPCLGSQKRIDFSEESYQMQAGDTLFCYTDGLIELENSNGKMWGLRQLRKYMQQYHDLPLQSFITKIVKEANTFHDVPTLEDDVTLLACRMQE